MGLLVDFEGKLYEWWLVHTHVPGKTYTEQWCEDCGQRIGNYETVDGNTGDAVTVFIPYFDHIAVENRDSEDAYNPDFTGAACVACGLKAIASDDAVVYTPVQGVVRFIDTLTQGE